MRFFNILLASAISLGTAVAFAEDGSERSRVAAQKFRDNQEQIHGKDKSEGKRGIYKADTATDEADPRATEPASSN